MDYFVVCFIFWMVTYVLIIASSISNIKKDRSHRPLYMPLIAGALNLAWEFTALTHGSGEYYFVIWFILDLLVFAYNVYVLRTPLRMVLYVTFLIVLGVFLHFIFEIPHFDGHMYSVFIIDILMAIEYLVLFKKLSPQLQVAIGVTRLLGDLFAGLSVIKELPVFIISMVVLLINVIYVVLVFIRFYKLEKEKQQG